MSYTTEIMFSLLEQSMSSSSQNLLNEGNLPLVANSLAPHMLFDEAKA